MRVVVWPPELGFAAAGFALACFAPALAGAEAALPGDAARPLVPCVPDALTLRWLQR